MGAGFISQHFSMDTGLQNDLPRGEASPGSFGENFKVTSPPHVALSADVVLEASTSPPLLLKEFSGSLSCSNVQNQSTPATVKR